MKHNEMKQDHKWVCGECIKCGASIEKQAPVAWWIPKAEQFCLQNPSGERPFAKAWEPLYTHPQPKREPMLDEQVLELWRKHQNVKSFARAIEAAHGIKE